MDVTNIILAKKHFVTETLCHERSQNIESSLLSPLNYLYLSLFQFFRAQIRLKKSESKKKQ